MYCDVEAINLQEVLEVLPICHGAGVTTLKKF